MTFSMPLIILVIAAKDRADNNCCSVTMKLPAHQALKKHLAIQRPIHRNHPSPGETKKKKSPTALHLPQKILSISERALRKILELPLLPQLYYTLTSAPYPVSLSFWILLLLLPAAAAFKCCCTCCSEDRVLKLCFCLKECSRASGELTSPHPNETKKRGK